MRQCIFQTLFFLVAVLPSIALSATYTSVSNTQNFKVKGQDILQTLGLTLSNHLTIVKSIKLKNGTIKTRFVQTYQGVPVWNTVLTMTKDSRNQYAAPFGFILRGIEKDLPHLKVNISKQQALAIAKTVLALNQYKISDGQVKLYIKQDGLNRARPVYRVSYFIKFPKPSKPNFFIDAINGQIIERWDGLTTVKIATGPGGNSRIGKYHYGVERERLDVSVDNNTCSMENNMVRADDTTLNNTHQFSCPENLYKEVNGAYSPINDAYYYGGKFHEMFNKWYNIDPLINKIILVAHDNTVPGNAYYNQGVSHFGDGNTTLYPLTDVNVVAHEIAHGFTEQNSNLRYFHQAGGINESFSDITGEALEFYVKGKVDWVVGGDITKRFHRGIRSFISPRSPQIENVHDYDDSMGVHETSGPFNRAFYLLSTMANWNIHKAFDIFVLANQAYWTQDTTFNQAALSLTRAAQDLNYDSIDVCYALKQVGADCGTWPTPEHRPIPLVNGETYEDISSDDNLNRVFQMNIPYQAYNFNVSIFDGTGDADLYVAYNRIPTLDDYDCKPNLSGNNESCFFKSPREGTYYILINAYKSYSELKLKAQYLTNGCLKHLDFQALKGKKRSKQYFTYCPLNQNTEVLISSGTGDADLYIKKGGKPSLQDFDCRPYQKGNNESCKLVEPGLYHIMIYGFNAYEGVHLSSHE